VGVDRSALTRATLTAYALPLFTMLVAALTVQGKSDGVAMVAALLGLLVGVACARLLARRWRDALMPVVLGRATGAVASTCAGSGALRSIAIPVIHQRSL
jgi:sigma-E factor negative regulatory protein RseC